MVSTRVLRNVTLLTVAGVVLLAGFPLQPVAGAPYEDHYGETMTLSLPGSRLYENFWCLRGDNITIEVWNYQGPQNRQFWLSISPGIYYEKDENLTDSMTYETYMRTGDTITLWVVFASEGFQLSADFFDDNTPLSVNIRVTRQPTSIAPYYEYSEHIEKEAEELRENITALQDQNLALIGHLEILTRQLDALNDTVDGYNRTQQQILDDLSSLQQANELLNATLSDLARDFEELNITEPDLSWIEEELTWIEENLTSIWADLSGINIAIDQIPTYDDDITELRGLIEATTADIQRLDQNLTTLRDSIPGEYDDSALLDRIIQLESWNVLLREEVDALKKARDETPESDDSRMGLIYTALVIGIIGLLVGISTLLTRKQGG